jgi:hypothetical protein
MTSSADEFELFFMRLCIDGAILIDWFQLETTSYYVPVPRKSGMLVALGAGNFAMMQFKYEES